MFIVASEIVSQSGRDAQRLKEARSHERAFDFDRQRTRRVHGVLSQVSADRLEGAVQRFQSSSRAGAIKLSGRSCLLRYSCSTTSRSGVG